MRHYTSRYIQPVALGFFDGHHRLAQIQRLGDPLAALNAVMDWTIFVPVLARIPRAGTQGSRWPPSLSAPHLVQDPRAPIALWLER